MKPRIAMVLGDPAGIGPELIAKLLAEDEVRRSADIVVVAEQWLWQQGRSVAADSVELATGNGGPTWGPAPRLLPMSTIVPGEIELGAASAAGGRSVLASLGKAAALARSGDVDAVLFAPLNKQALHLAGFGFEDELRWLASLLDYDGYVTEFNVLDELWTSRVTSHVPLGEVTRHITEPAIVDAIRLVDSELKRAGRERPRIGVAALNPHAGDGGNFGREEIDVIAPAVARARADDIDAHGPYPADTVFVRAFDGAFDAVVTMYHDQGQIAMKLMGFERGVTVLGGLPVPVTTPAHGSAYDIAGKGAAALEATLAAFRLARRMGLQRSEQRAAGH